jgi:YVTN family beta-propeller protein
MACGLPPEDVPPYDAGADGALGSDATMEGGDASGDSTPMGALHPDAAAADAGDASVDSDASNGLDAAAMDSGADAEAIAPDAMGPCDSGCVAYVASAIAGDGGLVTVVATSPLGVLGTIPVGRDPSRIAFTPDGTKAYVTESGDGTVTVIDTSLRQVTKTIAVTTPNGSTLQGVTVSPDGFYAYVSDGAGQRIVQIDTSTDTLTSTTVAVASPGPYGLAFSPDGGELWVGGAGGNNVERLAYPPLSLLGSIAGLGGHMLGDRIVFRPDFSEAFVNSGSGCPCCGELEMTAPGADAATYVGPYFPGFASSGYGLVMAPGGAIVYATSQATPLPCSAAQMGGYVWMLDATTDTFDQLNVVNTYDEPRGLALAANGHAVLVAGYATGGAGPGITAFDALTLQQVGQSLAIVGLPQDIAVQP